MNIGGGAKVGKYILQAALGAGAFGVVYKVVDAAGQCFALKMLKPGHDQDTWARFRKEVAIMRGIDHPHVMPVLDASEPDDEMQWFVMPLASGGSLASLIPNDRTWPEVVTIMIQAASGLAEYHSKGGIHRDIKPENLLLCDDGKVKVADFGVARCPELAGSKMTRTAIGTGPYMAPEVWDDKACQASDVYALAIVFWELVNDARHTIPAKPPRFLGSGPDFATMQNLYARMTAERHEDRPTAAQVVKELETFLAFLEKEPVPPGTAFWQGAVAGFMLAAPIALAALVVVSIASGGWAVWKLTRSA